MRILVWVAIAGWLSPVILAVAFAIAVRISPRLRAKIFHK
ncbi:hypothetical protein SAMN04488241_104143 [Sphingomonas rubra]|uniref:Uncharacterized protein n=1 Tax=Sphingomonas rubra TaxID=634430 RepID=A0A1I5RV65_9SPHN|nr:hypothetical protein SAMN04488241_104143 [Sphingomonas rubra]